MSVPAERLAPAGKPGADPMALRRLFDRLRDHLAQSEDRAEAELGRLEGALARAGGPDGEAATEDRLRSLAEEVLQAQRAATQNLARLADELGAMAEGLESRLAHAGDGRSLALRGMNAEVRALCERLEARLAEAEAQARQALDRLAQRLGSWEAAAEAREARVAGELAARLDESEARRGRDIAELLEAMGRLAEPPAAAATPESDRRPRPAPSRSAALLLSAGVACLGVATLALVLEPPVRLGRDASPAPSAEVTLRGPILIAPPRYAALDEAPPAPAAPAQPGAPAGAAAEQAFAEAARALEAGRPDALKRLRSLAEAGLPRAQTYLAKLYEQGKAGLAADPAEARRWTARAADAGDPVAMHNLALYYLQGRGGPRDDAVAARLFRRAAAAGIADSQFNLGLLYETGAGVDRNLVEAYRWFQIAANGGDLKARARAVALEERLSPKELAGAERLAQRFAAGGGEPEEVVLITGAATIAEAQKKLARLGYYIGPTDGQDTAAYRKAVDAFRRAEAAQTATIGSNGS